MEKQIKPKGIIIIASVLILLSCFFILGPAGPIPSSEIKNPKALHIWGILSQIFGVVVVIFAYKFYLLKKWAYYGVFALAVIALIRLIMLFLENGDMVSGIVFVGLPVIFFLFVIRYLLKPSVKTLYNIN